MATISVSLPSDGQTADAADYNTPIQTIVDEFNGNIDNNNIKTAAAISTTKLADDAGITAAKITDGTITQAKVATGFCVQQVNVLSSAVATGTTTIPLDDTIPQNTEGIEFMTLAITPKSTTNILVIDAIVHLSHSTAAPFMIAALFQDSTASAIAVNSALATTATGNVIVHVRHTMAAGTTSATTFKIRGGSNAAGTTTFNGQAGARLFGAITKSSIVITEYKAS